jgi:hypothetical protein
MAEIRYVESPLNLGLNLPHWLEPVVPQSGRQSDSSR